MTATITGLSITGGLSSGFGGGLYVEHQGTLTVTDCTISGNSAKYGGGLLVNDGTASLYNCTLTGNTVSGKAAAIDNYGGSVLIEECTVTGNSARLGGGGVFAGLNHAQSPTTTIIGTTIVNNSATSGVGGLYNQGTVSLVDTIVAGNSTVPSGGSSTPSDIAGSAAKSVTGSYDLIGDGGSGGISGGTPANNIVLTTATEDTLGVGPLGDYGGPTETMPLLSGSAALGKGEIYQENLSTPPITLDQRGMQYDPSSPDIGAFQADPLVVNTTSDGAGSPFGDMSLRQAVILANALGGIESIIFNSKVFATAQTITLTAGQLELSSGAVTITGPAAGLTISGADLVVPIDFSFAKIFQVDRGVTATMSGLTITSGSNPDTNNIAIQNYGVLALSHCVITSNQIGVNSGNQFGVDNASSLTATDCEITRNNDGGVYQTCGAADLVDCTISGNGAGVALFTLANLDLSATLNITGGAIENNTGVGIGLIDGERTFQFPIRICDATITGCTITGNSGRYYGGALYVLYGDATLTDCTIAGNSAVGSQSYPHGRGGGVGDYGGTVNLSACTISGNSTTSSGGGVDVAGPGGTLTAVDCTIAGNSASTSGGGVNATSTTAVTLTACTITLNTATAGGGGLSVSNGTTTTLTDTIVAGNTSSGAASDISGTVAGSYNLVGTGGAGGLTASNKNLTGVSSPMLGVLGDYGGTTETIPLLPKSPAIGAGEIADYPGTMKSIDTDQRGMLLDTAGPDIGAFQTNPLIVNTTSDGTGSPSGDLTLRQAVNLADDLDGTESIAFSPTVFASAQTITLTAGQLELSSGSPTITGAPSGLTISGGGASRVLQVDPGVTATITGLTITGGSTSGFGGGIRNYGALTLTDSTLTANKAAFGGAILTGGGSLSLANCTIAGNTAAVSGGGIEARNNITVISSTFNDNVADSGGGGAIDNPNGGEYTITIGNSILSGDSCGYGPEVANAVFSLGNNLVSETDNSSGWGGTDKTGTSSQPLEALLGSLGNYGGPTETIPLLPGSPAIGAGAPMSGITSDQRGLPLDSPVPDIGAFQSQGFTLTPVSGSTPQFAPTGLAFANPLAVTVTANNPVEPVAGGIITWSAPGSGASAALSALTSTIGSNGAASITATANATLGSYAVTATASGAAVSASFTLTNTVQLAVSSIATVSPNPRNTAVSSIDVTFNEPISTSTPSAGALTLTDNGGANLINGGVTLSLVSGDTYAIGGLSSLTTAEGNYELTANAADIQDQYGFAGTGTASTSWLMDTTPPTSTVNSLPAQTTSTSFNVSITSSDPAGSNGSTPSGVASIAIYDSEDGGAYTLFASVTQASPAALFTGRAGHTYGFYSIATDNAGNTQPAPTTAQESVQILPPVSVSSIAAVSPNPRNTPVSTVAVTFSIPVNPSSFSASTLTLTDNGTTVAITGAVTLSLVSGSTYDINGLGGLTAAEGNYGLTVNASAIDDTYGNPGTGSLSTSWLMDTTPPTSTVNPLPAETTSTSFSVSVTSDDPAGSNDSMPSGVASIMIYDSEDGGAYSLFTTSPSALFTGQAGHTYGFYSIATDNAGNVQATPAAAQETVQIILPLTITSIAAVSPNPRNTTVSSIDITFSVPIKLSTFIDSSVTLTDNGGGNLITSAVTFASVHGSTYQINGLSSLTANNGNYTLTVNAASIDDQNGNPGTGSLSTSWLMDTTPPTSMVNPLPERTTSLTFAVSVTGSDGGSPPSRVASFNIYVSTDGGPWSLWTTVPASNPTANFTGMSSTTYRFYSTATDNAGNTQAYNPYIEASTYLPDLIPPVTTVDSSTGTNPSTVCTATGTFTLNLNGSDPGGGVLTYFEVYVSVDSGPYTLVGPAIPAGPANSTGIVQATIPYQGLTDGAPHTYAFYSIGLDSGGHPQAAPATPNLTLTETFANATPSQLQTTALVVEDGAVERSFIRYLQVDFNESDSQSGGELTRIVNSLKTASPEIQLYRYDLNDDASSKAAVSLSGVTASVIDHAIELDFGASGLCGSPTTTAADGYYEIDIKLPGGTTDAHHFYRLLGDVTGDGTVDENDLDEIATAINLSNPTGFAPLGGGRHRRGHHNSARPDAGDPREGALAFERSSPGVIGVNYESAKGFFPLGCFMMPPPGDRSRPPAVAVTSTASWSACCPITSRGPSTVRSTRTCTTSPRPTASSTSTAGRRSPRSRTARATPWRLSECAFGMLSQADQNCWHWWASGNYADTIFSTLYPINSFRKINMGDSNPGINADLGPSTPSSFHPGGANFAFCDGSVRFIKDSVECLPFNPTTGLPLGYVYNGGFWSQTSPNAVYQALSTRNGGEVISSDQY